MPRKNPTKKRKTTELPDAPSTQNERLKGLIQPISPPNSLRDDVLHSVEAKDKKVQKSVEKTEEKNKMEEDSSHKSGESSDSASPPHSPPTDESSNLEAPPLVSPSSSNQNLSKTEKIEVEENCVTSVSISTEEMNNEEIQSKSAEKKKKPKRSTHFTDKKSTKREKRKSITRKESTETITVVEKESKEIGESPTLNHKRKLPMPLEIPVRNEEEESDDEEVKILIKDVEIREYWEAYEKRLFQQQREKREEYLSRVEALRHPKRAPIQNPRAEELKKISQVVVGLEPEGYAEEESENYHLPSENPSNCRNTRSAIYYAHEDQQLKVPDSLPAFREVEDAGEYCEDHSKVFEKTWDQGLIKSDWQPPQHSIYFLSKRERSLLSPRDKGKKAQILSPEMLEKVAARFAATLRGTSASPLSSPVNNPKSKDTPKKQQLPKKRIKLTLTQPEELPKETPKKMVPIIKHPLWYEEEKFLLKELYLAFGNDWKEIEGLFLSGKTYDQIQSFFESNRNALLAGGLPKNLSYSSIFKQVRTVTNKMGSERPSKAENSSLVKFSRVDIEVGDWVFVFWKPEPSYGIWIEGQVVEQRFKVHMFHHISIASTSGKYWFSEEDVRLTLPIGTKVWALNEEKKETNSDDSENDVKEKIEECEEKKVLIRLRGNETQVRHLVETRKEILDKTNIKTFSFCNCTRSLKKAENNEPVGEKLVFCRTCPLSAITEVNLVFLRLQGNKSVFSIPPIKFDDFADTSAKEIKGNFDTILRSVEDTINFGFYGATNSELAVEYARKSTEEQRLDVAALKIGVAKRELLIEIQRHFRNLFIQLCEGQRTPCGVGACVVKMQKVIGKFNECKELLLSCAEQRFQVFKEVVQEFG
eukprot:TRINITY_DN2178_c0_g1_i2.p1 TRINITY_DN2178_c0_g1~~TRINITY_DN2178_c0_g1_i2.p1  ORF type:complete len:872 (-),score=337.69 TRINITY_DN2178_c0_g1_i2:43-2658(-)